MSLYLIQKFIALQKSFNAIANEIKYGTFEYHISILMFARQTLYKICYFRNFSSLYI